MRYIQEMLGHSSLETTQVYTHVAASQLKAMHERYHPARLPKAEPSLNAPDGAEAISTSDIHSADAPEVNEDAMEPVSVMFDAPNGDLDARAALLATLDAEAAEES